MSLFTIIKDKLSNIRSRSKKNQKAVQRCRLEDLIDRRSRQTTLLSLDSIGPVTTSMIIKRRIDRYIYAVCGLEGLKNNKRFYIARETEAGGSIIKTSLYDKQTGKARTLYHKSVVKTSP